MKKILLSLLSLMLVLGLTSCSKEEQKDDSRVIRVLNFESKTASLIVEYIVQQWETQFEGYGVEFVIDTLPFSEKLNKTKSGDFEISLSGWGPDYAWPTTFTDMWTTGNDYNEIGYSNSTYDDLALQGDKDTKEAFADLQKAEEVLLNDAVVIPIYQKSTKSIQNPDVQGIAHKNIGADYLYKWVTKTDGKMLNIIDTEKMPSMDPMLATDQVSFSNIMNSSEGLLTAGKETGVYEAGVAKEWSFDKDTMTWTFVLRDDSMWTDQDGNVVRPVKASDFTYAWDRVFSEDSTAQYGFVKDVACIENYEADDDANTFKVTVKEEKPYFLSMMAFGTFYPVNKEFVEEQGDSYGTTLETTLTNGAFYLSSWDHTSEVVLTKNQNYWNKDVVQIPGIYTRVIEGYDPATGVGLFEAGEIDRVGLSGDYVAQYQDDKRLISTNFSGNFYLIVNVGNANGVAEEYDQENGGNPLLDNVKIRQALALSFDKNFICDTILANGSIASDYYVPANFSSYDGVAFEEYRQDGYMHYNTSEAVRLWDEGMAELGIEKE